MPQLTKHDVIQLFPVAFFHVIASLAPNIALGAGTISASRVVSSWAPLLTAVLASLVLHEKFTKLVYPILSCYPLVAVVCWILSGSPFSLFGMLPAVLTMVFASLRNVFSKKLMNDHIGENMSAENIYAVLSIFSFFASVLFILFLDIANIEPAVSTAWATHGSRFLLNVFIAGISRYLFYELLFGILHT